MPRDQVVQAGGQHRLLVVIDRPPADQGDQRGGHRQRPAVRLRAQPLAGLPADPVAAAPAIAPGSRTLIPPTPRPIGITCPPSYATESRVVRLEVAEHQRGDPGGGR